MKDKDQEVCNGVSSLLDQSSSIAALSTVASAPPSDGLCSKPRYRVLEVAS
jgi:hypothetical protein